MEIITTHINADFDSLASMLAAKKLYSEAVIVFPGPQEKSVKDFLVKSTLYTFEIGNIKEINLEEVTRLILVDIRHPSRIGRFSKVLKKPGVDVHIYDHHPSCPGNIHGSVEITTPFGSTTTIMTLLLKQRGIDFTPKEATVLMLGIYEDTGSLSFTSTTVEDYEAASFLLSKGARLNTVSHILTKELTSEQVSILNDLIHSATTYTINGMDVVISHAVTEVYAGDIAIIVHKLRDIENLDIIFSLIMVKDRIHLIARSRIKEVNVGDIAGCLGGGGHPTAASATIKGMTLIQAKESLIGILKDKVFPVKRAKDLMSYPVITVFCDQSIEEAKEYLVRYNINAIPVKKGGKVAGIISRQVIEKALYHGLNKMSIAEYMTTDFSYVSPDTTISDIQRIIIEENQRILPVMSRNKLTGVITRTDLLRSLHERLLERPHISNSMEELSSQKRLKHINRLMREGLPERVFNLLQDIGKVADDLGFKAYGVGGFVRDLILKNENLDIDVVIEGDGILFANEFSKRFSCRVKSHERFGTAVIIFPDGFKVDIATARLEYYEKPGALPTVELSSIKLDLYRRDFTINTLAVKLNPLGFGKLLDFYGGLRDLKSKTIRVLHNLSFIEDPTRILRALRFEQRFGFVIGKHTQSLIRNAVRLNLFESLAGNRLFTELIYIMQEEDFIVTLKRMSGFGLTKFIHPRISIDSKKERLLEKARDVLSWYHLLFIEERVEEWLVTFLVLTDCLKGAELSAIVRKFGISGKARLRIIADRGKARAALGILTMKGKELKRSEIYHLLSPLPVELVLYVMVETDHEPAEKILSHFVTHLRGYRTRLKGEDLKRLGVPEGPVCGEVLRSILDEGLNGEIKNIDQEIAFVRELMKKGAYHI
ncbi:MAG: CBS domain-containing protein [Thermodesulfobacteriota bacterium]